MIALLVIIVGIAALGVASLLNLTPDTRDPAYGLGPFFSHRIKERVADPEVAAFSPPPLGR